jgi:hypothetical protein
MFMPAETYLTVHIAQRLTLVESVARKGDRDADTLAGRTAR